MKKLKFIYLVLLSFGLIFLTYSVDVNAADSLIPGWEYYEESPFNVPSTDDFYVDTWVSGSSYGVDGYWNFIIPFELEYNVSLDSIKVVTAENLFIEVYLQTYGGGGYDDWLQIDAYDYFDEMNVKCEMILHDEIDYSVVDVSDKAYQLMTSGYEFKNMHLRYPAEIVIYRIDFVFEIDFNIDLTSLEFDEITDVYHQYMLELYYNPSVYYDAYEQGLEDGYGQGYQDGYDDGILESDVYEAYQQGFIDGEKSKLATNNEAFYNGIGKWLVPAVITVIVLGGIVSIASIKRREQ